MAMAVYDKWDRLPLRAWWKGQLRCGLCSRVTLLHAALESKTATRKMGKSQKYGKWNNGCDLCLCHMTSAKLLFLHFPHINTPTTNAYKHTTMRDRRTHRERKILPDRGNVRFMVYFKPMQHENSLILTSFHCNAITNNPFILHFIVNLT